MVFIITFNIKFVYLNILIRTIVFLQVRKILIPPRYYGQATSYEYDIALLYLDSVQLHAGIMPVCVDWQREFTIPHGMLGTVIQINN